jgi:hypothetical protein
MTDASDPIPWDEIREHLFAGSKIAAIKVYREATGADLKTSKEFIEALEERMRDEFPEHFKTGRLSIKADRPGGCLGLLLLAAGGLAGVGLLAFAMGSLF